MSLKKTETNHCSWKRSTILFFSFSLLLLLTSMLSNDNPKNSFFEISSAEKERTSFNVDPLFFTFRNDAWQMNKTENYFFLRDQILISIPCLPCWKLVVTSNTSPILIFPWIHPFGSLWWFVTSWKCVFTTSSWTELFFSVFSHEILSNLNTCINQASIQKLLTLFLVKAIWFVLHIAAVKDSGVMGCHSPKRLLYWFHWEQLIVPSIHQVAPIYLDGNQIQHTCLQLLRKDLADWKKQVCEKVSIVGLSAVKCFDSFSFSVAFEITPVQWSCCKEKMTSAFCEFQQNLVRDLIPNSLGAILFHRRSFLFGTWTNEWPLSNTKFLCKYGDGLWHLPHILFHCFYRHRKCRWTST